MQLPVICVKEITCKNSSFPSSFFFFYFFFSFPLPPLFQAVGLREITRYKISNSQVHFSLFTREERVGRSALPMSQEDVVSSRLAEHTLSVIPISPFLLSHPGGSRLLHSSHPMAAQCQDGALPVQAVKPCALRSFNTRTRKVGNFGETEVKTSSCGRQNYFSSLLPPNLNPAQNLSCRNNFQLLQFSL